jgi:hypothetical protein
MLLQWAIPAMFECRVYDYGNASIGRQRLAGTTAASTALAKVQPSTPRGPDHVNVIIISSAAIVFLGIALII